MIRIYIMLIKLSTSYTFLSTGYAQRGLIYQGEWMR